VTAEIGRTRDALRAVGRVREAAYRRMRGRLRAFAPASPYERVLILAHELAARTLDDEATRGEVAALVGYADELAEELRGHTVAMGALIGALVVVGVAVGIGWVR